MSGTPLVQALLLLASLIALLALTQARRLDAARIVVVGPDGATLRARGEADESLGHDEIVSRLSP